MTPLATSTVIQPVSQVVVAGAGQLREAGRRLGRGLGSVAEREDVAQYPVLVRALRNLAGLPDRPPHELALGVVALGIMLATDSIVIDLAANVVAVLFVNHPHADPRPAEEAVAAG
ncbi:hypothetical protein [Actinomycetospora atypica]|uniref:Uncharacterized protein n=1 Tax=Actinomycetospora atypica TaxID=1290095 RepID=A0ABV9YP50_9PSEU